MASSPFAKEKGYVFQIHIFTGEKSLSVNILKRIHICIYLYKGNICILFFFKIIIILDIFHLKKAQR